MMKQIFKHKGSTLLIVLLIISVFTILFLSFIGISGTTKKQNTKVEETSKSLALAEMGSKYYTNSIKNEFDQMKNEAIKAQDEYLKAIEEAAKEEAENEEEDEPVENNGDTEEEEKIVFSFTETDFLNAKNAGIDAAYNYLIQRIDNPMILHRSSPSPIGENAANFKIEHIQYSRGSDNLMNISFDSIGHESGIEQSNDALISAELVIDLNRLLTTSGFPYLIPDPENSTNTFTKCTDAPRMTCNEDKTKRKVIGNLKSDKLPSLDNTVLYITGDLDTKNNNNSFNNTKIHIGGDAIFKNLTSTTNTIIEVLGDATFKNITGSSSNVTICVHGNLDGIKNTTGVDVYVKSVDPEQFKPAGACYGTSGNSSVPTGDLLISEKYSY